jgi:hypothetical protein
VAVEFQESENALCLYIQRKKFEKLALKKWQICKSAKRSEGREIESRRWTFSFVAEDMLEDGTGFT